MGAERIKQQHCHPTLCVYPYTHMWTHKTHTRIISLIYIYECYYQAHCANGGQKGVADADGGVPILIRAVEDNDVTAIRVLVGVSISVCVCLCNVCNAELRPCVFDRIYVDVVCVNVWLAMYVSIFVALRMAN